MVTKAFFRANIPFVFEHNLISEAAFQESLKEKGWVREEMQGDFLLKHINTSFNENVVGYSKLCGNVCFCVPVENPLDKSLVENFNFTVSEMSVYCFDTGVGIATLHIPYDSSVEDHELVNVCSALRCSVEHSLKNFGRAVVRDGNETYLGNFVGENLTEIFGASFSMFAHSNDNSQRRIDMFTAALCEKDTSCNDMCSCDRLCYRLANTIDDRDKNLSVAEEHLYRQQEYIRWGFSKRGCGVVANLTGEVNSDGFLENRWFASLQSNYFYLYIMVLHQKYAIYNYLNTVAADNEKKLVRVHQERLIDFNAKYVFSIVSDEFFIQRVYRRMKKENDVDDVYLDLQDELKRLFEYSKMKSEESNEVKNDRLNIISVLISILCFAPVVMDTLNIMESHGCSVGFGTKKELMCSGIIFAEAVVFIALLVYVLAVSKKKK